MRDDTKLTDKELEASTKYFCSIDLIHCPCYLKEEGKCKDYEKKSDAETQFPAECEKEKRG